MRKSISLLCTTALFAFGTIPANAFTLSVLPPGSTIGVGETVLVDIVASDLVTGGAPSLSSYDIEVAYDASILTFSSITFGTGLDVLGRGLNFQQILATPPGTVRALEFSFDTVADLNQLQGEAFTLFTLAFTGAASGSSGLSFVGTILADAYGNPLEAVLNGASVSVSAVPLPAAAWLLLSGLAGVMGMRRPGGSAARRTIGPARARSLRWHGSEG